MSEILSYNDTKLSNEATELVFTGQMEANGAEIFKAACHEHLSKGVKHLVVDLSKVTVISSSGIGALMVTQEDFQDQGGWATYVALSKEVRSVVRLMDLEAILNIAADREEALQGLAR